jgi:hypothetical protein
MIVPAFKSTKNASGAELGVYSKNLTELCGQILRHLTQHLAERTRRLLFLLKFIGYGDRLLNHTSSNVEYHIEYRIRAHSQALSLAGRKVLVRW